MKLRNIKGLIRKTKYAKMAFETPGGQMLVTLVKQDLIETLDTVFGPDGATETGLMLTPAGLLAVEGSQTPAVGGVTEVDWMPAVTAAARKLQQYAAKPVITNDGQVVIAGELKDLAADLMKLVGPAPEESAAPEAVWVEYADEPDLDDLLGDGEEPAIEDMLS